MYRMYVSTYVRASRDFIDIILDIALIHHLPGEMDAPRACFGLSRAGQKKKNFWSQQDYTIQHRNRVCTERAVRCLQEPGLNHPDD